MTSYGMVIDVNTCVGCYNCFLTCRDEYAGNDYPGYSAAQPMSGMNWMKVNEIERGQYPHVKVDHVPVTCSHCDSAACVKLDQTGAIYRRADGIVLIDPEKAKGNKELVKTLPVSPDRVERRARAGPEVHLVRPSAGQGRSGAPLRGVLPQRRARLRRPGRSQQRGRRSGGLRVTEVMHPEYAMGEKVTYRDLPKKFVAGTVIYGDVDEVAKGST